MNLLAIKETQFPLWKAMRKRVYHSLDDEFYEKEMKQIFVSDDWYCYFLEIEEHQPIGFVEISSNGAGARCHKDNKELVQ